MKSGSTDNICTAEAHILSVERAGCRRALYLFLA